MAIAPIGPNYVKAQLIRTDSPIVPFREYRSTVLFNEEGEILAWRLGGFKENEGSATTSSIVKLPQEQGLYGITLKPRFEHYHNFLDFGPAPEEPDKSNPLHFSKYQKSFEGLSGIMPDKDGVINDIQNPTDSGDDTGPAPSDLIDFYSWIPIPSILKEKTNSSSTETPQTPSTTQQNGTFENVSGAFNSLSQFLSGFGLDFLEGLVTVGNIASAAASSTAQDVDEEAERQEAEDFQKAGPKWEYKLLSIPANEYGTNSSFTLSDNGADVKKLVPFQEQKQGNGPGNIAGGIHWGLEKKIQLPKRVGFYLDIFTPKTFDFQNKVDKDSNIEDEFDIVNTSYIVIEIEDDESTNEHYYLVISTKGNPQFFKVISTKNERGQEVKSTTLISEYSAVNGETLLQGSNGVLRLTFRNIQNHVIINNNVDASRSWVITRPTVDKKRQEDGEDPATSDLDGFVNYMTLGGKLRVYGGNISCGISYNYLNYYNQGIVSSNALSVIGAGRDFFSSLTVLNGNPNNIPEEVLTDGDKLSQNSADSIIDDFGGDSMLERKDNSNGGDVTVLQESELKAESIAVNSPNGFQTLGTTVVTLSAGKLEYAGLDMGFVKTPVLKTLYQIFPKVDKNPGVKGVIDATILSIEDSWEAEGTHAIKHSGKIRVWMWDVDRNNILARMSGNIFVRLTVEACTEVGGDFGNSSSTSAIFTGMLANPQVTETAGNREVSFEIFDYWKILEDSIVMNSPYFDGVIDEDVVRYWLDHVGFPNQFIRLTGNSNDAYGFSYGLDAPLTKFSDHSTIAEVIKNTAKKYSKFAMFDRTGAFKYRQIPSIYTGFTGGTGNVKRQFAQTHRTTNRNVTPPLGPGDGSGGLTPGTNAEVCYEVKTYQHFTHEIFNQIHIMSVDVSTRGFIIKSDTNFPSILEEDSHGFLGYYKPWIQTEAAFGSSQAVAKALRFYTRMYRPPYIITWKTFGGDTDVDVYDIVTVDGNKVVVQKIHNSIDGETKKWFTEWEGEWLWPPQINNNISNDIF